jgi:hypothetical protein
MTEVQTPSQAQQEIASLDEKIEEIRTSQRYQNLIIKNRAPQEVRDLRELMQRINAFEQQKLQLRQAENINSQLLQTQEHGNKILSAPKSASRNTVVKAKPKKLSQPFHTDIPLPDMTPAVLQPPPAKNITPFQSLNRTHLAQTPGQIMRQTNGAPQVLTALPNSHSMPVAQRKGTAPPPPVYPIVREEKRFTTVGKSIKKTAIVKAKPPKVVTNSDILKPPKQAEADDQRDIGHGGQAQNDNILNEINDFEYNSDSSEHLIGEYDDV